MLWSNNFCTSLIAVSRSEASLWSISQSTSSLATKQLGYVLRWCRRSLMTFSSCSRSLRVKSLCEYHWQRASATSKAGTRVEQVHPNPVHAMDSAGAGWKSNRLSPTASTGVRPPCRSFCCNFKPHIWKNLFSAQLKRLENEEHHSILSPLKYSL